MRTPGWESRLAQVLEAARHQPYQLGTHDCFRVACAVEHALTGRDRWPLFAGRYRTKRRALYLIAQYAGKSTARGFVTSGISGISETSGAPGIVGALAVFAAAACEWFGGAPVPMNFARRGDIAQYIDPNGEPHLAVVSGATVAVIAEEGVLYLPRSACAHAWEIG